uniref:Uncharacterized protein n=1 Tax=Rhizophora mucronata TaxID=61149 RepID=A0A2P2Q6M0_RHIMU
MLKRLKEKNGKILGIVFVSSSSCFFGYLCMYFCRFLSLACVCFLVDICLAIFGILLVM